jgi:hypothetical protein
MKNLMIILFGLVLIFCSNMKIAAVGNDDFIPFQDPIFGEKENSFDLEKDFYGNGSNSDSPPQFRTPPPSGSSCPKCGSSLNSVTGACNDDFKIGCDYVYDDDSGIGTGLPITDGLFVLLFCCLIYAVILSRKRITP